MANQVLPKTAQRSDVAQPESMQTVSYTPRVDILETSDELTLFADMPGVKPEAVDVRFEDGELSILGRCPPRQEEIDYLCCEYGVGNFFRAFTITQTVDANKITAELKNGVLTVHLPKAEAVKPKKITVKGA